jgi:DNA-directed RNA polymerase subunit F
MKQERMKVLELLEAGTITAAEAKDLLETMKKPETEPHFFTIDEETKEQAAEKFNKFASHVDQFTRDFGAKVQDVYKEVEPKVRKAGQTILEKTAAVFDEIARSLNESLENARKEGEECCCGGEAEECGCDVPVDNGPRPEEKDEL